MLFQMLSLRKQFSQYIQNKEHHQSRHAHMLVLNWRISEETIFCYNEMNMIKDANGALGTFTVVMIHLHFLFDFEYTLSVWLKKYVVRNNSII